MGTEKSKIITHKYLHKKNLHNGEVTKNKITKQQKEDLPIKPRGN